MKQERNQNSFLISCVCSVVLLLTLCYFGITSTNMKGTAAVTTEDYCVSSKSLVYSDISGKEVAYCCPNATDTIVNIDGINGYQCLVAGYTEDDVVASEDGTVCYKTVTYTSTDQYICSEKAETNWYVAGFDITEESGTIACTYTAMNDDVGCVTLMSTAFEREVYEIVYYGNGGSLGAVTSQTKKEDESITITPYIPARTGYNFTGWNTAADGTGTQYSSGASYSTNADLKLYAQWEATSTSTTYTVTLDGNGGTVYGNTETEIDIEVAAGDSINYLYPATWSGYTFNGWYTAKSGGEYIGSTGGSYTPDGDITLYAHWTATTYTVTYNANGGSGAPSAQTKTHDVSLTLSSTKPTRSGYTFLGWATASSATSATYQAGGTYTTNASTTLYAVWKASTYTVTYNANGGSGAPSAQTKTHDVSLTLSSTKPTRSGYTFLGWATASSATSATYQAGGTYTTNASTTLYAVWKVENTGTTTKTATIPDASTYCQTGLSYNGKSQTLTKNPGEGYTFSDNTRVDAGSQIITATLSSGYVWSDGTTGTKKFYCAISKAYPEITLTAEDTFVLKPDDIAESDYEYNGDGELLCNSDDVALCEIKDGKVLVTAKSVGITQIVVRATEGNNYNSASQTIFVVVEDEGRETTSVFTATFNQNGGTLNGSNNKSCTTTGTSCDITGLPTATREGYTFKGWGSGSTCDAGTKDKLTLKADTTYYACWAKNAVTDTPNVDDEGNVDENVQTGDIAIALVWFFGLFAIGYAFYYFKSVKEN